MTTGTKISYEELANFLFLQNTDNKHVVLNLDLPNSKELFFLCYDLFLKGLVMMFGENDRVEIQKISLDKFFDLKNKMKCADIECNLQVVPVDTCPADIPCLTTQNYLNLLTIDMGSNNLPLSDYKFELQTPDNIYKISFDIVHYIPDIPHNIII